jgi:hypothetical protein
MTLLPGSDPRALRSGRGHNDAAGGGAAGVVASSAGAQPAVAVPFSLGEVVHVDPIKTCVESAYGFSA